MSDNLTQFHSKSNQTKPQTMKLIELHILQSFPVSCLNRDDVGSPKSAVFGGVTRARVSSQCLKRAIRLAAQEIEPDHFKGERSRLIVDPIRQRLVANGLTDDHALEVTRLFCDTLATLDANAAKKGVNKVKTMTMFAPSEIDHIANEIGQIVKNGGFDKIEEDKKKREAQGKKLKSALDAARKSGLQDAADIALFGRMVASDHSLTLEGAAMFGHALSTHNATNDIDYWTAVDDRQKDDSTVAEEDKAGSGGLGTAEFTSATYYRYAAVNLGLLFDDKDHLEALDSTQRKAVLEAFLRATLVAVPGARKNSMNAATLPHAVLGIRKDTGQPLQLVNAFEHPVQARGKGLAEASREAMAEHHEALKKTWGIQTAVELWMPETPLDAFIGGLTDGI
jgi:CRISPR system Cascade subunit CasC